VLVHLPERECRALRIHEHGHAPVLHDVERSGAQRGAEGLRLLDRGVDVRDRDVDSQCGGTACFTCSGCNVVPAATAASPIWKIV
jgi:hypothetical protein